MKLEFKIGDKVTSIYEPDKIGIIIGVRTGIYSKPVYTIKYEDGNEYANYADAFRKVNQ